MTASKRLPAYAKPIAGARRKGMRPESGTVIVRLDTWPPKPLPNRVRNPIVVIPPDADPEMLRWDFLARLNAIVMVSRSLSPPARVRATLRAILAVDPERLIVLAPGEPAYFVKSAAAGVEVAL